MAHRPASSQASAVYHTASSLLPPNKLDNRSLSPHCEENELDNKFVVIMLEIEKRYQSSKSQVAAGLTKHEKIRIEQWSRKLCQVTNNKEWKRNRNLYAMWLLDMVLNKHLDKPFSKVPPEGNHLDTLQPAEIRAKLSSKVT